MVVISVCPRVSSESKADRGKAPRVEPLGARGFPAREVWIIGKSKFEGGKADLYCAGNPQHFRDFRSVCSGEGSILG